jgi:hypothetical protein
MKRLPAILIAVGLPAAVLVGVALLAKDPGPPADAWGVVAAYVGFRNSRAAADWEAVQFSPATRPTAFELGWSQASYSLGPMYQTTWNERLALVEAARAAAQAVTRSAPGESLRPLPYPPRDAWCVELRQGEAAERDWVVVALHADLYNADWVVHELAPAEAQADVAALGCAGR